MTASASEAGGLAACRALADDAARLRCYDALADELALETPLQRTTAPDTAAVSSVEVEAAAPAASSAELFGASAQQQTEILAGDNQVETLKELQARITSVSTDNRGRFVVILDNDQRWRQVERSRFFIDVGDEVVIKRGMLGSYTLKNKSKSQSFKVRRLD